MEIEILKPIDLKSYKELIDECFGTSNDLEKYQKYNENQAYKIFVVKEGTTIIGSATQYALDLFTFDYREKQIAKYLLSHIIENARNEGYHSISLTCLDTAYPAHKLYESVGFTKENSLKYAMVL